MIILDILLPVVQWIVAVDLLTKRQSGAIIFMDVGMRCSGMGPVGEQSALQINPVSLLTSFMLKFLLESYIGHTLLALVRFLWRHIYFLQLIAMS